MNARVIKCDKIYHALRTKRYGNQVFGQKNGGELYSYHYPKKKEVGVGVTWNYVQITELFPLSGMQVKLY